MEGFTLIRNDCLGPGYHRLVFEGRLEARPGQFVMVKCSATHDPLLPRPFSLEESDGKTFSLLFQVRGRGTALLARKKPGDVLHVLGPLGRGFPLPQGKALLVAGGIGVAPLRFLVRVLKEKGKDLVFFYGARSAADLILLDELKSLGVDTICATEDGSLGARGLITEPLREFLEGEKTGEIFACGPLPMLYAVSDLARKFGLKAYLSLEARMACGLGMCLGCAFPRKDGSYLHVCTEGPVVSAEEVF